MPFFEAGGNTNKGRDTGGVNTNPSNYRPTSLTCVLCKILDHIVASSLVKHFTELDIFYEMQHIF